MHKISEELIILIMLQATVPIITWSPEVKPEPLIVMSSPPDDI